MSVPMTGTTEDTIVDTTGATAATSERNAGTS